MIISTNSTSRSFRQFSTRYDRLIYHAAQSLTSGHQILLSCDQDSHDPRWVLLPEQAIQSSSPDTTSDMSSGVSGSHLDLKELQFCGGHDHLKTSRLRSAWRTVVCRSKDAQSFAPSHGCPPQSYGVQGHLVLDLRNEFDFKQEHIGGSHSLPLPNFTTTTGNGDLFGDPEILQWASASLKTLFLSEQGRKFLDKAQERQRNILVLCYHGDISRLATAALRKREITAFSVKGGFQGLRNLTTSRPGSGKQGVRVHMR